MRAFVSHSYPNQHVKEGFEVVSICMRHEDNGIQELMGHERSCAGSDCVEKLAGIGITSQLEVQYDYDWLSIDPFKSEIAEADIAVEKLELLVQDMQA